MRRPSASSVDNAAAQVPSLFLRVRVSTLQHSRNPVVQCWCPATFMCRLRPLRTHALFPSSRSYSASPSPSLCYPTYPTSSPSARNSRSFYLSLPSFCSPPSLHPGAAIFLFRISLDPPTSSRPPPSASLPFPSLRRHRLPLRGTRPADFTARGAHGKRFVWLRERRRKWEVGSGGRSGAFAGGTQSLVGSRVVVVYCIGASV
jgi:hypothetical protein